MMIHRSSIRVCLVLCLLIFALMAGVNAHAQTFTCSPCSTSVTGTGTATIKTGTPYPSTLTVSGLSGTVATVSVQLQGLTTNGSSGNSTGSLGILLKSPGGQFLEILGNLSDASESLNGLTLNISDTASSQMPDQAHPWSPTTGTLTFKPTSIVLGTESNPQNYTSPGPGFLTAGTTALSAPHGVGTLNTGTNGVFSNVSPNGTWSLFFIDNKSSVNDNISITGWSLTFTVNAAAVATTTTLGSNLNPSFTATPSGAVTLTATVSSGSGTPSGGTVAFKDGGTTITGCGTQAINGSGQATCTTTFTSESNHLLSATYSGSGSFTGSTTTTGLNQFVKNHTTIISGQYCNSGTLTVPGDSTASPAPSIVNVGTDTTAINNAVSTVSVFLNTLSADQAGAIRMLLVAPSGESLEFWGSAGNFTPTSGNFSFVDTASNQLPQIGTVVAGSYQPTAYTQNDTFLSGPSPAPQAPSTFAVASPAGNPTASTLLSAFNGATANGDWKLFAFYNGGVGHTLTVGSWCLDITPGTGAITTTTVASALNPATTSSPVTITATVQSAGNPVPTGSVTLTENGQPVTGASPSGAITINASGKASITTSSLSEGDHNIKATYTDSGTSFNTSFGSLVQREDNATGAPTVSVNTYSYCNTGKVTIPGPNNASNIGAGNPNPSSIFVNAAPGTINKVTLTLNNYQVTNPNEITSLLVGPLGTTPDSLDFFSAAGGTGPMGAPVTLAFDDAASNLAPQNTSLASGTFKPTSYGSNDTYTPSLSNFFTLPTGPYQYAPPSGVSTLGVFANQNPNGTWGLYFNQTAHSAGGAVKNGWCLNFTVNRPDLSITQSHVGNFKQGATGEQYTLNVTNNGPGSSAGAVTVIDTIPAGLTATAISGTNWNCTLNATVPSCTRSDALAQSTSYEPITVTVNVAGNAAASVTPSATLSGGGDNTTGNNTATDPTTVVAAADLTVTKTHTGNFTQGDSADTYTITVTNSGPGATDSAVTVQDNLPTGLTATAMSGTGWTCNFNTQFCMRSDVLASGASYPTITLTVSVASNAAASVINNVTVAGGGEINTANDTANDSTTINPNSVPITITTAPAGLTVSVDGGAATASPVNATWIIGSSHTIATSTPQPSTPGKRFVFTSWSDAGAISHSVTTPSTATTYTATFGTEFQLTTAVSPSGGGTVTPTSGTFFAANAVVPLVATANAGFTFVNWTGNVASANSASTTVTMPQAQSVTANFSAIVKPATTTALTSSANPSSTGQSVTFTAVVSSGVAGTPTGTVTFMEGANTLGSSTLDGTAKATFATSTLAAGDHNITAVYGGDGVFAGSASVVLDQTVSVPAPANFTLGTSPTSATIKAGATATFTITASAQNGFNSAITLACSTTGTPSLATCEFSTNPITPGLSPATSTLTIKTTAPTSANLAPGDRRRSSPLYALWLLVTAMLLISAKSGSQDRRKFLDFVLVLMLTGGCIFQTACGNSKTTPVSGTPPGSYIIIVTGTSGGTQNTTPLTLTVQ